MGCFDATLVLVVLGLPALAAADLMNQGRRLTAKNMTLAECSAYKTIEKAGYAHVSAQSDDNIYGWTMYPKGFTAANSGCWKFTYPMCGGRSQSPTNIVTASGQHRRLTDHSPAPAAHDAAGHSPAPAAHDAAGHSPAPAAHDAAGHSPAAPTTTHAPAAHSPAGGDHSAPAAHSPAAGDHSAPAAHSPAAGAQSPSPPPMVQPMSPGSSGPKVSSLASYGKISSKPALTIDPWFRSVRADGNFGKITVNDKVYQAKHLQLVTSSLHKIDDHTFAGEMLIVHELEGAFDQKPWSPAQDAVNTVIVSVLFKQSDAVNTYPEGSYSALWEALGFPKDRAVLPAAWHATADTKGFQGWEQSTLSGMIGSALEGNFYGYHGSLPVPPCWENVIYYVLEQPLPVSHKQVEGLLAVFAGEDFDHNQRTVQHQIGQEALNLIQVTGSSTDSCGVLEEPGREATMICNKCLPGEVKSPVDLHTAKAVRPAVMPIPGWNTPKHKYHATTATSERGVMSTVIRPAPHHDFGMLELGGRFYTAKMITVHAVGLHAVDGVRYDGEIHIHHYLYGDWFDRDHPGHHGDPYGEALEGDAMGGRRMYGPGDRHGENVAGGPSYQVIVAIPLQVTTNPTGDLMDTLQPHGLQSGVKAYMSHLELEAVWKSNYLQYRGSLIHPQCDKNGNATTAHWIMYTEPVKVSADDLYTEFPTRSGFDTSPSMAPEPHIVNMNHAPMDALGKGTMCNQYDSHSWTYADTECWPAFAPQCAGEVQSPINIETENLVVEAAHHKDTFLNYAKYHPVKNMRVTFDGHSLKVANKQNGITHLGVGYIDISGSFYFFRQFHLHCPSEHTVDGHQHTCELHLVHQRQDHWGATAYENEDFLVVAIFFDIGPTESPLLKQLYLPEMESECSDPQHCFQTGWTKTIHDPVDLGRALGPILQGDYFRYKGSYTTPPCNESVKWFVFKNSLSMSEEQWSTFKNVLPNPANARPVQPLNSRKVALNSFEAPGETYNSPQWEFWLDRKHGRNRDTPTPWVVLGGVIGGVCMTFLIMAATFIRQNPEAVSQSAGGLVASEQVGRATQQSRYGRM